MKGITVEEELCRAARVRRRELEKLFKNIKVNLDDSISAMHNNGDECYVPGPGA